jgi:antitoxin component YwqK of YwqJK toxin-antitoxin module
MGSVLQRRTALRSGDRELFFGGLRIACERPDGSLHGRMILLTTESMHRLESWTFRDGVRHGPMTGWHRNGQKRIEAQFEAGQLHGVMKTWDDEGNVISSERFDRGRRLP